MTIEQSNKLHKEISALLAPYGIETFFLLAENEGNLSQVSEYEPGSILEYISDQAGIFMDALTGVEKEFDIKSPVK